MIDVNVSATYGSGKPLSALADLIEKRMKWLRETPRDAVVATAINVLKSIRAQTRRYKGKVGIRKGRRNG